MEKKHLEAAVREISETGSLSFAVRRKLLLSYGPLAQQEKPSPVPCSKNDSLKRRAMLALACAKKANKVWLAYKPADKRPQQLIRRTCAYLEDKLEAEKLMEESRVIDAFMVLAEEEQYNCGPIGALAVWKAVMVALYDEALLEEDYEETTDGELDFYDWDAAHYAAIAVAGADENWSQGQQAIQKMKFWIWYLEEAAKIGGLKDCHFPEKRKVLAEFQAKQNPPKPMPEAVTMEALTDYLDCGIYDCHFCVGKSFTKQYEIHSRSAINKGICPKCGTMAGIKFYYNVNCLKASLPGGTALKFVKRVPLFTCNAHPNVMIPNETGHDNPEAAFKRIILEPARIKELEAQLEMRAVNCFHIGEEFISLNGVTEYHHDIHIPEEIAGIRWLDRENEHLEIDLVQFGPHVKFASLPYHEYVKIYPERIHQLEDKAFELTMKRHWVRCYFLDHTGKTLGRIVIISRFHVEVENNPENRNALASVLQELMNLNLSEAQEKIGKQTGGNLPLLTGLNRKEAEHALKVLRKHQVKCRILPVPLGSSGI